MQWTTRQKLWKKSFKTSSNFPQTLLMKYMNERENMKVYSCESRFYVFQLFNCSIMWKCCWTKNPHMNRNKRIQSIMLVRQNFNFDKQRKILWSFVMLSQLLSCLLHTFIFNLKSGNMLINFHQFSSCWASKWNKLDVEQCMIDIKIFIYNTTALFYHSILSLGYS